MKKLFFTTTGILSFALFSSAQNKPAHATGKGKIILLDRYFNSEKKKDVDGNMVYWHYVWEEKSNAGFSTLGDIFQRYGAKLSSLDVAPSATDLKRASVYIIVDPDHVKDNPAPNYVSLKDISVINDWVKDSGTLVLMANDSANCELQNFNKLAGTFGIKFTDKSINMVKNDVFEQGVVFPGDNNPIFKKTKKMFLKEISTLEIKAPAKANTVKNSEVIMATAKYGRGTVFAVGDPWLYNEYLDRRKLPAEYENFKAAEDLVKWLLKIKK